nr:hypothetical protein [uncultured Acetatifactor sp.]
MTEYTPNNGWIEGKNKPHFSNRHIYEGNPPVYIMAGDRPLIRLAERRVLLGTLRLFFREKPLEDCEEILMRYRPGMVQWQLSDPAIPGEITLTVTSPGDGPGLVLQVKSPAELRFCYGGLRETFPASGYSYSKEWNIDVSRGDAALLETVFCEEWLEGNHAQWTEEENEILLTCPDTERRIHVKSDGTFHIQGCQAAGTIGTYFSACFEPGTDIPDAFAAGCARSERLAGQLAVNTPDEYINTACAVAAGEMDGAWRPPKTMHGNMNWSSPFVGWLVHCGHAMLGRHERMAETLKAYAAVQEKADKYTGYEMNETYTRPSQTSRFYGKGRITEDQGLYNMQTQFFHQMIQAWRFSGDPGFAEMLRDALRLHIEWEDACFDPDGTGLYASVINTWPTDSVSYSDGGAVEETCYAYAARCAMAELTEGEESERYAQKADQIKAAFLKELWIPEKGYPGVYRERNGRLHEDAWIYSSFLPVECGLLDTFQQAQALYYPLWAFQRAKDGGFWFSNWTPGIWSVRENGAGENMQQACAFFKGGEEKEALDILERSARRYLNTLIPGDMTHATIETANLFIKAVAEGLFGYRPDYPNDRVTIAPMLPFAWDNASMQTGDVSIRWQRRKIHVSLTRPAFLTIRMRLYAEELYSVTGADNWYLEPGIGGMTVVLTPGRCSMAEIELHTGKERDFLPYEEVCHMPTGEDIFNPQGVDKDSWGEHMAFRRMPDGYFQAIRVHLRKNPQKELLLQKQRIGIPAHAAFEKLDISDAFNADVTRIFRQKYLSPRPEKGCYTQIGLDGFSLWTFPCWEIQPPGMSLEKRGEAKSAAGIPFAISAQAGNIAFASLWDNYPDFVEVSVDRKASIAAVLISGSTNPNQCGIENARLTFTYEDGTAEELPLVNPDNYISLCAYPDRASALGKKVLRTDVFNKIDIDLVKDFTPEIVELGENVRALSIRWPLISGKALKKIRLTACSQEIVVGLMGVTLVKES